jgi:N-acetylmuramoyl-L-alanine amidase
MFSVGGTVASMAKQFKADAAINFNYANTDDGIPIGRVIHEGKVIVSDIPKTIPREELYMSADGSLHIGKAPVGSKWALEGSPRLIHSGKDIIQESIKRDQLGSDVWSRPTYRTAVGLRDSKTLVVVRTRKEIELSTLVDIMFQLGCKDALNGDGGGSSYFFPEDSGWGRKLGSGLMIKTKTSGDETKVKKLIALCDGHGMETAGKRTPIGINDKETGANFMHENEFNRSVVKHLDAHLKRCGFDTLLVAPTDIDTPLSNRTALANSKNADFYLSVHANAVGNGEWNNTRGIETFHYTKASEASKKYASIIHKYLIGGTKLPDRGVKSADFYVLKETKMPSVLVECAFMTSKEDAALLLTDAYRKECAEELAKAICEMFSVSYVTESKGNQEPITPTSPDNQVISPIKIDLINGDVIETVDGLVRNGVSFVEVRKAGNFFEAKVGYDSTTKKASLTK